VVSLPTVVELPESFVVEVVDPAVVGMIPPLSSPQEARSSMTTRRGRARRRIMAFLSRLW